MMKRFLCIMSLFLFGVCAESAEEVIYSDTYADGDLSVNADTGGGITNWLNDSYAKWIESDGALTFSNGNKNFLRRAIAYTDSTWQSDGGFQVTVYYTTSSIGSQGANRLSFGLISTDTEFGDTSSSSYYSEGFNPFYTQTDVYSFGVNVINPGGLYFTDGSEVTELDVAGDNVAFQITDSTPVVFSIQNTVDGAAWSYSINGTEEASGILDDFDFDKSYRFIAYGQDNEYTRTIESVEIQTLNPPPNVRLIMMTN